MSALVSVLIPTFRAETFITRAVGSVLQQTYPNWEIIIASDDQADYQKILHDQKISDPRIRFTSTDGIGTGPSTARNAALDAAKGDIIAGLDADDLYTPERLEQLVPFAQKHGAATSGLRIVREDTLEKFPALSDVFPAGLLSAEHFIRAHMHASAHLIWDRNRLDQRWNESVHFMEDLIFALNAYSKLDGIYYDPALSYIYYKHAASITGSIETIHEDPTAKMVATFEDIIVRTENKNLGINNKTASDAFLRFLKKMLEIEKRLFAEPITDPTMGFYDFFKNNRAEFFAW